LLRLLLLTPPLWSFLFRTSTRFRLTRRNRIAWCRANLKLDDLIPLRIATITLRNNQEFSESLARVYVFYYIFDFAHVAIMAHAG
jgi:hypothetical protein